MRQTRRIALMGLMAMIITHFFPKRQLRGQESQSVDILWRVPVEQIEAARKQLAFEGKIIADPATIDEKSGLPRVYIFAGSFTLNKIANALLALSRDAGSAGIIVRKDQGGKVLIENDNQLDAGTITIDQGNGRKVIFRESETTEIKEILKALALMG